MRFIIIIAATILGVCVAVGLAIGLPKIPECPEVRTDVEQRIELAEAYNWGYHEGEDDGFNFGWYCCNHPEDEECIEWLNRPE